MSGVGALANQAWGSMRGAFHTVTDPQNAKDPRKLWQDTKKDWRNVKEDWLSLWGGVKAKPYSPPAAESSMKSSEAQAAEQQQGRRRSIYSQQGSQPKSGKTLFGE